VAWQMQLCAGTAVAFSCSHDCIRRTTSTLYCVEDIEFCLACTSCWLNAACVDHLIVIAVIV
jgi:hypothetical protein